MFSAVDAVGGSWSPPALVVFGFRSCNFIFGTYHVHPIRVLHWRRYDINCYVLGVLHSFRNTSGRCVDANIIE